MIKEICAEHGVQYIPTSKLFYGEYSCSLSVDISSYYEEKRVARSEIIDKYPDYWDYSVSTRMTNEDTAELSKIGKTYHRKRSTRINQLYDIFDDFPEDTVHRSNRASVTFYFDDPDVGLSLVKKHGPLIKRICLPKTPRYTQYMRNNTDKIVRDTYYFGKYPFRIIFTPPTYLNPNKHIGEFILRNYFNEDGTEMKANVGEYDHKNVLYLGDFNDVFLVKIGLGECIRSVTEIVLSKDI